jgi:hypothetical protein
MFGLSAQALPLDAEILQAENVRHLNHHEMNGGVPLGNQ